MNPGELNSKATPDAESRSEIATVSTKTRSLPPAADRGQTFIADDVVSAIARIAAEGIEGVHRIGEANLRTLLARLGRHHGIDSEVGMKEAAVDIDVVVEFGYPIRNVARELRQAIVETVERMTGRQVVEVQISVVDVHIAEREPVRRRQLA